MLYTATSDAAMDKVNNVFHGPTQWFVGEARAGEGPRPISVGAIADLKPE